MWFWWLFWFCRYVRIVMIYVLGILVYDVDEYWMCYVLVLVECVQCEFDEILVGVVLVGVDGQLLGEGWNFNIVLYDFSVYVEIVVMCVGGMWLVNYWLFGSILYVILELCVMCVMVIVYVCVVCLVYGVSDFKIGVCGSVFDLFGDVCYNYWVEIYGGVLVKEVSMCLINYFCVKCGKLLLLLEDYVGEG